MSQPEFYVNGTDFPPLDETIANGSIFHKASGEMLRKVNGEWVDLANKNTTEEKE